jgi:hypothetical protein
MSVARSLPGGRAVLALGAVALASPLFALSTSSNNNFVLVRGLGLVVLPLLGLVAILGAVTSRTPIVLLASAGSLAAAGLQLLQFGRSPNWLGGNGSTFSLLLALGVGLLVAALAPIPLASDDEHPPTTRGTPR